MLTAPKGTASVLGVYYRGNSIGRECKYYNKHFKLWFDKREMGNSVNNINGRLPVTTLYPLAINEVNNQL